LATAESNRAIPAYQTGPVDRLGRGQRMRQESNLQGGQARPGSGRVPSPIGLRIHGGRRRSRAQRSRAHPGSGRELPPAASPSIAEDGALEAQRLRARSRSRRRRYPDRFILHMRRAENSNPTPAVRTR
jgi:hypothetical protein